MRIKKLQVVVKLSFGTKNDKQLYIVINHLTKTVLISYTTSEMSALAFDKFCRYLESQGSLEYQRTVNEDLENALKSEILDEKGKFMKSLEK